MGERPSVEASSSKLHLLSFLKDAIRLCKLCGAADELEDEEHVLLHCPIYARIRIKLLNLSKLSIIFASLTTDHAADSHDVSCDVWVPDQARVCMCV